MLTRSQKIVTQVFLQVSSNWYFGILKMSTIRKLVSNDVPRTGATLLFLVVLVFANVLICNAQSPEVTLNESPKVTAALSLPKSIYRAGEPIQVKLEVSNKGETSVLIANEISMSTTVQPSHVDFVLVDHRGNDVPAGFFALDSWGPKVVSSPGIAFLESFLVLRPGYSLTKVFKLDTQLFRGLSQPGTFSLYALYSSNGLSYPPALGVIGVTETDVKLLPFVAWSGKIRTNTVLFKVLPPLKGMHQ